MTIPDNPRLTSEEEDAIRRIVSKRGSPQREKIDGFYEIPLSISDEDWGRINLKYSLEGRRFHISELLPEECTALEMDLAKLGVSDFFGFGGVSNYFENKRIAGKLIINTERRN